MFSAHARARALLWNVVAAINANLSASLLLSTRAHLGVSGMMAYVAHQCRQFVAGQIEAAVLQETLDRVFLGRTTRFDEDPPAGIPRNEQAIHVLKFIDSVDKLPEVAPGPRAKFRETYEYLSEFAHPNLQARMGDYHVDNGVVVFHRIPAIEEDELSVALSGLRLSEFVVTVAHEHIQTLLSRWPGESTEESVQNE